MSFGLQPDPAGWRVLLLLSALVLIAVTTSFLLPPYMFVLFINYALLYLMVLFVLLYLRQPEEMRPPSFTKAPSLAVLIPCFNSEDTIAKCIKAVQAMTYPRPFKVVVVDDGSTDGSREILEKTNNITLISFKKNKGKGAAMTRGLKEITQELIVCIDSDTYPEKKALLKAIGFFKDPRVGAVNGSLVPTKRTTLAQKIQHFEYLMGFGLWNTVLSSINGMTYVTGPFTVFRRSALKKAGYYFDARNLAEDMEVGLRLHAHHYKLKVCPAIANKTDVPTSFSNLAKQRDRWYRSRVFNLIKYRKLFFKSQYGSLGVFALPYLFFMELLMVVLFARISLLMLSEVLNYLQIGHLLTFSANMGMRGMWEPFSWNFALPTQAYFFFISLTVVGIFYLSALHLARYRPRVRDAGVIALHIFLYPLFIYALYGRGMLRELLGAKPVWERIFT